MENSGGERRVDHATDGQESPRRLLDLLITRLAEPAAVLDESLTIVATNTAFEALVGADDAVVGERLTAVVPSLTRDAVEGNADEPSEYVTVRTGQTPERWTEFGFDRHGTHLLCIGRDVDRDRGVGAAGDRVSLTALQATTQDLLAAETEEAVATRIVETATDVLGLAGATVYLFDSCQNTFCPAGLAGESGDDARTAVDGGADSIIREVFLTGMPATLDSGDRYHPLGEYGVLHTVAGEEPASGREAGGASEYLAGAARTALERVDREATLRERAASYGEQAERLAELEQTLSMVRRVQRVLVDADTVSDIEQGVCAALTESPWLSFAWVGRAGDGGVEPRAWSGPEAGYLEAISLSAGDSHVPPAVETAALDQVTTVDAVAETIRDQHWSRAAISREFQAAISVPLRADGVSYGVLTAYADRPVEWDDSLRSVITELGDSVAMAIRDRERRSLLAADAGVELDLTVTAPDAPLGQLAAALGVTVGCTEVIPVDGTTTRLFVSAPGADGDAVADAVEGVGQVDSLVAVADGDRYELLVEEPTVVGQVVRHGGRLDTASVTAEELTVTVALAADADVRTFVDRLRDSGVAVQLTARRNQTATTRRADGIRGSLETALTDRQLEALRTAYGSGFFEWPRETTGEGVAEMLGVAQPTVNRHLRVAQRKLLALVFDDE
ncbi:bacterio-opsin activator domain-containing protein [Haloarcula sediminis]|uniref:bacterio-opsin activator domain-containing protein n=1 Tax=Haloarcula sediminis TaxID=3111777 RepID=UPI002D7895AA|nr:bacterio-opsin activator domain-containing protein [Haloarcula sp. CK38]